MSESCHMFLLRVKYLLSFMFVLSVGKTHKNHRVKFSGDSEKSQFTHQHTISMKLPAI